jgi:hypothetical protein
MILSLAAIDHAAAVLSYNKAVKSDHENSTESSVHEVNFAHEEMEHCAKVLRESRANPGEMRNAHRLVGRI